MIPQVRAFPFLAVIGVAVAIAMVMQGNRTAPVVQPVVQSASTPFSSYVFGPGIVEASTENTPLARQSPAS